MIDTIIFVVVIVVALLGLINIAKWLLFRVMPPQPPPKPPAALRFPGRVQSFNSTDDYQFYRGQQFRDKAS